MRYLRLLPITDVSLFPVPIMVVVLISFFVWPTLFPSQAQTPVSQAETPTSQATPADQPVETPTPQVVVPSGPPQTLGITFQQMGSKTKSFSRPFEQANYTFGLPPDVVPTDGSFLILDLEYILGQGTFAPAQLEVALNGEVLETLAFFQGQTSTSVQIPIPTNLLRSINNKLPNSLDLAFTATVSCEEARLNSLLVKNSSRVQISHFRVPVQLDLSIYPKPIYLENTLHSSSAQVVLPEAPTEIHAQSAAMIGAYLGAVSDNQLPLTATLGIDLAAMQAITNSHFLLIGTPEEMPILEQLSLPISFLPRQHQVSGQTPAEIAVNQPFTYSVTVKNEAGEARDLQLVNKLPPTLSFLGCDSNCQRDATGLIRWEVAGLKPNETRTVVGTVVLSNTTDVAQTIDHTITLFDGGNIVNVKTLSSTIGPETTPATASPALDTPYFFARNGLAVAETDGVVQEIPTPGGSRTVIIIATGITSEGLLKGARALSTKNLVPGILAGNNAIVQDIRTLTPTLAFPIQEFTLASRGYKTEVIKNVQQGSRAYLFNTPAGLRPTANNFLALHFGHSTTLAKINGVATISLNGLPIGTIDATTIEQTTAQLSTPVPGTPVNTNPATTATPVLTLTTPTSTPPPTIPKIENIGWLNIPFPAIALREGENLLEVAVVSDIQDPCATLDDGRFWFTVYNDSFIHTDFGEDTINVNQAFNLSDYPLPYIERKDLDTLAILLPNSPTASDFQRLLTLTRYLGQNSGGTAFWPKIGLGGVENLSQWADFNVIAMGRPTQNSVIASINRDLPQRFVPDSDQIEQVVNNVVYRLPPDLSIGVVQILFSPWNRQKMTLVVTGSSEQGVDWATNALTDNQLIFELGGNLVFVQDKNINALNTQEQNAYQVRDELVKIAPELTPEATVAATTTPQATFTPLVEELEPTATPTKLLLPTDSLQDIAALDEVETTPSWLPLLLIVSGVATALLFIVIIWRSRS